MMCSGASRHRRAVLLFLYAVALIAVASCVGSGVSAQNQLTLADFDSTGLAADVLALISTGSVADGNFTVLYRVSPSVGNLVDGELGIGAANSLINSIRWRGDTVNDLLLANGSDLDLSTYFGTGGSGADLTLRIQTASGTGTGTFQTGSANQVRFDMNSDAQTLLNSLSSGDRLIVALTRALLPAPDQVTGLDVSTVDHDSASLSWNSATNATATRSSGRRAPKPGATTRPTSRPPSTPSPACRRERPTRYA